MVTLRRSLLSSEISHSDSSPQKGVNSEESTLNLDVYLYRLVVSPCNCSSFAEEAIC